MYKKVVANWKMHLTKSTVLNLLNSILSLLPEQQGIIVCPAFVHIDLVAQYVLKSNIRIGAQDCSTKHEGAYTGDISAAMLKDLGCKYVIVGHSERRTHHSETNQIIANKILAALEFDLTPILCIGEPENIKSNKKTKDYLQDQISSVLPGQAVYNKIIIAYEPLWSIGTGITPEPQKIEEVVDMIKNTHIDLQVLYGGSVNTKNCSNLAKIKNLDGILVGGASLNATEFCQIVSSFIS